MDSKLETIFARFPDYRDKIIRQISENEDFECLCADYELCINMLKALEKETELRHSKVAEYLEIKLELEHEVQKYLLK